MPLFKPYEIHIDLPQYHFSDVEFYHLRGHWHLKYGQKIIRAEDPYRVGYLTWIRLKEWDMDLSQTRVRFYVYLRQNTKKDHVHTCMHGDVRNIVDAMRPAEAYNPHKYEPLAKDLHENRDTPFTDLCHYARDLGVFAAHRADEEGRQSLTFWKGKDHLSVFQLEEGCHIWTPGQGLEFLPTWSAVFKRGVAELRSFV